LLLIFGINDKPIIVLIAITNFFLVFIPTLHAFLTVPFEYREAAASFRAGRFQEFRHVSLLAALPQIFVALRLAAGASILTVVGIEFVVGSTGIGWLIWNSWNLLLSDRMYVGIVTVAIAGALFTIAVGAIGRLLTPWSRER
jgi:ABC-type nitrate/sulfonate/bicarbonate transport system permease component